MNQTTETLTPVRQIFDSSDYKPSNVFRAMVVSTTMNIVDSNSTSTKRIFWSLESGYTFACTSNLYTATKLSHYTERWKEETKLNSSLPEVISNMWFLRIIGLGPALLPHLRQLINDEGGLWCLAAEAITGHDPKLPEQHSTNFKKLKEYWLQWFTEKNNDAPKIPEFGLHVVGSYKSNRHGLQLHSVGSE
jgi:hypothetical protein